MDFKNALLTHKTIITGKPSYLHDLLKFPTRDSRQSLIHNRAPGNHTFTSRAFSIAAPRIYNKLPDHIKNLSIPTFKKHLKAFLLPESSAHKTDSIMDYSPSPVYRTA